MRCVIRCAWCPPAWQAAAWPVRWLCSLAAAARPPHGGLFLIAVIDNPIGFLAALLCGSLLTALIMGVLKKPVKG